MPNAKITQPQFIAACELRVRGTSLPRIIRELDLPITRGCLAYRFTVAGVHPAGKLRRPKTSPKPLTPYSRDGWEVRPFTPEEDALLLEMQAQNLKRYAMAKRLKRTHATITYRLARLAEREAEAETVEERAAA